jgi:hypothetical protein
MSIEVSQIYKRRRSLGKSSHRENYVIKIYFKKWGVIWWTELIDSD